MKILRIIIICFSVSMLFIQASHAQSFLTQNKVWSDYYYTDYYYLYDENGNFLDWTTAKITTWHKVGADSLIEGTLYKQILSSRDSLVESWNLEALMREDGNKVFRYDTDNKSEYLLYDFGMQPGDTLFDRNGQVATVLQSVRDTVMDKTRKLYTFSKSDGGMGGVSETWIEGIGALRGGLFRPLYDFGTGFDGYIELVCFLENGALVYHNPDYDRCYYSDIEPIHGQDIFPLHNAKWTGIHILGQSAYFSYLIQGDTVVDNITRSKCYYIPDINKPDTLLIGYFHVIDSIVYYQKHEISQGIFAEGLYSICPEYELDYPLYDFSLEKGDVFSYVCADAPTQLRVNSVEYVEFGGEMRKKINFDRDYNGWFIYADYWIEGMGSKYGFFDGHEYIPACEECWVDYICFSVNNEVLYMNPNYSECPTSELNSIQEIKPNQLTIFPNPMKSVATVRSGQPLSMMQIYNGSGVLLRKQVCNGELQTFINKQSFSSGMYFVKCISQAGNVQIEKLIIQ